MDQQPLLVRKRATSTRNAALVKFVALALFGLTYVDAYAYSMERDWCCCPQENIIKTKEDCEDAFAYLGWKDNAAYDFGQQTYIGNTVNIPYGCALAARGSGDTGPPYHLCFNSETNGAARSDMVPICYADVYTLPVGTCCCPEADKITSKDDCEEAFKYLGWKDTAYDYGFNNGVATYEGSTPGLPSGCSAGARDSGSWETSTGPPYHLHFNSATNGAARSDMVPICGSAPAQVQGCMDATSANHNPQANVNNACDCEPDITNDGELNVLDAVLLVKDIIAG